jgi:transcriptional regulator with XRE-family HTH domain
MSDKINIAFGRVFQRLRKERGWSQLDVECYFGIGSKYQSDVENGKRNVSLLFIERTAKIFGMKVYLLMELVEKEKMKLPTL